MTVCHHCGGSGREPDWRQIGATVRHVRTQTFRVSLREYAKAMGCSPAYLSDLERGRRAWNSPKGIEILRDLDLYHLVRREPKRT